VSTSRELYRSARASYVELLLAQQNALKANLEYIDAAKRFKKAQIRLYKSLGGGWR
jgi:outer membrane protein TolC